MTEITCTIQSCLMLFTVAAVANARTCPSPLSENDSAPPYTYYIYIAAAHFLRIRSKLHIAYILQNVKA